MMNTENKAKWVAALRSGKFTQTRSMLFNNMDGGFCCLGVEFKVVHGFQENTGCGGGCFLDLETRAWESVLEDDGISQKDIQILAGMNDTGFSFAAIADWIEAHL